MARLTRGRAQGVVPVAATWLFAVSPSAADDLPFSQVTVDAVGPVAPWAKGVADINQDGLDDILIGGHKSRAFSITERIGNKMGLVDLNQQIGELIWYEAPHWTAHVVSHAYAVRTDVEAGDIDADGDVDIVALTDSGVVWFEAPHWQPHVLDARKFHDVELVKINADERPDLVLRNQTLFGYNNGDALTVMLSEGGAQWRSVVLPAPQGEGLEALAGSPVTLVVNDVLFTAPQNEHLDDPMAWRRTRYTTDDWAWPDVVVATGDFNADGHLDVALAPAESKGQRYRLSWFEGPATATGAWREHVVIEDTEAVHHALVAADFDSDGHLDLATAQMTQGADPDEVLLLRNLGNGKAFSPQVLATIGSHNVHVLDADGDFDPDIVGANWQKDNYDGDYPVTLWRNERPGQMWRRHQLDADRPGQALNVLPADLDGDGRLDVVSGAFWYKNPGALDARWPRRPLGGGKGNALAAFNLDANDELDVISTAWSGYAQPSLMERLRAKIGWGPDPWQHSANDLVVHFNAASVSTSSRVVARDLPGDYPHGAALSRSETGTELTLSMHAINTPLITLAIPNASPEQPWSVTKNSPHSQNEALSAADINQDGAPDVVTGTRWVDGRSGQMNVITTSDLVPDRHVVIPATATSSLEIVVGDEAISRRGRISMYTQTDGGWQASTVATVVGPMSLDAGDIDLDGDVDIVVGEHNLKAPSRARLLWFERRGQNWHPHLIGVGDEHHDGAQLADFDQDGDLDVVSIGWSHARVLLFENPLRSP